jgi:hypothetical protein
MDVEHGEMVEKQLDALIERRSRKGDVDPDEREELWQASVRRYHARREEELRAAWCEHHEGQAACLRVVLEELIADHEQQAERYRDQKWKEQHETQDSSRHQGLQVEGELQERQKRKVVLEELEMEAVSLVLFDGR